MGTGISWKLAAKRSESHPAWGGAAIFSSK